jgi:hypothetical protein
MAGKSFWMHRMQLLGDMGHMESRSVRFETVEVSVRDRCIVSAKHNIVSEIVLDVPDSTPR